jgi:hypothetical protein
MKIKIKSCSLPTFWYNNKIGNIYEVEPIYNGYMLIERQEQHTYQVVEKEDCEIVNE